MITRRGGLYLGLGVFLLGFTLAALAIYHFYILFRERIGLEFFEIIKGVVYLPGFSFYMVVLGAFILMSFSISLISFKLSAKIDNIEIERILDRDRVFMGDYVTVTIRVKNRSNRTIGNLFVSDLVPDIFNMILGDNYAHIHLPPKGVREFSYIIECPYRGVYVLGPTIVSVKDTAGLFKIDHSLENFKEIIVYPSYEDVKKLEILQRAYGSIIYGPHRVKQKGSGYDFWGIRRYVIGDHIKFIDWRSSARMGRLMVKEYEAEKNAKLYILIDASKSMGFGRETMTKLDFAARAAVLLAYLANRFQDDFGLLVFSDNVHSFLEAKKGKKQFLRVLEELAKISPKGVSDLGTAMRYLIQRERRAAIALIITDLEGNPTYYEEGIKIALAHKIYPMIISPVSIYFEDWKDLGEDEIYKDVVISEHILEREKIKERIRKFGIDIVDADPNVFIGITLETYLVSKAKNIRIM